MRSEGYCSWLCLCVCLSVKQHLISGVSIRPENAVTYWAGNEGKYTCGVFSETLRCRDPALPALYSYPSSVIFCYAVKRACSSTRAPLASWGHAFSRRHGPVHANACICINGLHFSVRNASKCKLSASIILRMYTEHVYKIIHARDCYVNTCIQSTTTHSKSIISCYYLIAIFVGCSLDS